MIAHTSHQSNTTMPKYTRLQIIEAMQAIIREADDPAFADLAEALVSDILHAIDHPAGGVRTVETIITPFGFLPLLGTISHDTNLGPVINWNGGCDD